MKAKLVSVISIDSDVYKKMKMYGASIYATHSSTIHLSLNTGEIVTLGSKISKGKHHILIKEDIRFDDIDLTIGQNVHILDHSLRIDPIDFLLKKEAIHDFESYLKIYKHNQISKDNSKHIIKHLENVYKHLYNEIQDNKIYAYIYKKISAFLIEPNYSHAKGILGLGPGLTPLGDDVLVGYIMGINTMGVHKDWFLDILKDAKNKTNKFSYQNLCDTYEKLYPYAYIKMIEEFFEEQNIFHTLEILNIGQTSGLGIVIGFLYGVKVGERNHEKI
jgi:hypothetical protein